MAEGSLDMLVAAGVLDAADADADAGVWRRAILRAAEEGPPQADADLRSSVEAIIEQLGSSHLRHGALDLAVALGAVSPHDRLRRGLAAFESLRPEPVDPELAETLLAGEDGDGFWTMSLDIPPDFPEDELAALMGDSDREPEPDPRGALVRVLAAPADRRGGVRLTSIAIHERATVVRWHALADEDSELDLCLEIHDDVGTDYGRGARTGSRGNRSGVIEFPVRIPPAARELRLTWCGGTSACEIVGV